MESGIAGKARWSPPEVALLVQVWAEVCDTPGASRMLRGGRLNKAISDRYDTHCRKSGLRRRSANAILTQCERIGGFARFMVDYDRRAQAQDRPPWFQLRPADQENKVPPEWRRFLTIFTQEMYDIFVHVIIPSEAAHGTKLQKKRAIVAKQITTMPWTVPEEVRLARRWGRFMKNERLTLTDFEKKTFDKQSERFTTKNRSSFSALRKIRNLVGSYKFISAFNECHHPGWFELTDEQRERQLEWKDLPQSFEDIEHQVFCALDDAMPRAEAELEPLKIPSPNALSPVALTATALTPMPFETELDSTQALDKILLEDDDVESAGNKSPPSPIEIHVSKSTDAVTDVLSLPEKSGPKAMEVEGVNKEELPRQSPQLHSDLSNDTDSTQTLGIELETIDKEDLPRQNPQLHSHPNFDKDSTQSLDVALESHQHNVHQRLCQLRESFDSSIWHGQQCLRDLVMKDSASRNLTALNQCMAVVLENQIQRLTSILQLAQETCCANAAETESLTAQFYRRSSDPSHKQRDGQGTPSAECYV